jgi:hypothetical protein
MMEPQDYPVQSKEEWRRERAGEWTVTDEQVRAAAVAARARGDAAAERAALDELIRREQGGTSPLITDEDVRRAAGAMPHTDDTCTLPIGECQWQRLQAARTILTAVAPDLRARVAAEVLTWVATECGQPLDDFIGDLTVSAVPVTRLRVLAAQYQAGER